MIPSLGRRTRLLFRTLGAGAFNKVVVVKDGRIAEASDEAQDEPKPKPKPKAKRAATPAEAAD